jgi:hypothetical protein
MVKMKKIITFLLALAMSGLTAIPQSRHSQTTMYPSYKSLIMAGYQGWFRAPRQGQVLYSDPARISIDMWPDVSEYQVTYET